MRSRGFFYSLISGLLLAATALAQINEGTIIGTVQDAAGAAVPGAQVEVTNVATNISSSTRTNNVGEYLVTNLVAGRYAVSCQMKGFRQEIFTDLTVRVGTSSRVDFSLQPGDVQQSITVTSEAPLLQTENAAVGANIPNESVVELPLRGRLALDLALLENGVAQAATGTSASSQDQLGGEYGKSVVISGVREHYNNYTLDGTTIYQSFSGYLGYSPSIEAIQEVRVDTSNNNARQGRVAGGTIAFTTRAGTNTLHASLYEFLRNDKFDALSWGNPPPKPAYRYNQFGFMLAGPWYIPKIYNGKNRTFFMINYEGLQVRKLGAGGAIVPTSLEKKGIFTGGAPVVDPLTGNPFPNNVVPASRINPVAAGIASYYPDPNTTGNPRFNYVSSGSEPNRVSQVNLRADHKISAKDNIFYSFAAEPTEQVPRQVLAGLGYTGNNSFFKHTISYNRIFSPAILNNARFGIYDRDIKLRNFRAEKEDVWSIVGLNKVAPRITIPPPDWGIPSVSIFGYNQIADQRASGHDQVQLDYYDDLTWNRGKHLLQMGGTFLREHQNVNLPLLSLPGMSVDGRYTGNPMGDFLLGNLASSSVTQGAFDPRMRQNHWGIYFQDDWRATSRLTVNMGLRYEYNSPAVEVRGGKNASWDPGRGVIVYPGVVSDGVIAPFRKDFSPRLGFAYRVQDKTVVRAAYGIYWNTEFSSQTENELNPPFVITENFFGDPKTPTLTLNNPFPVGTGQVPLPSLAVRDSYMKDGYIQQWNFTIERNLPFNSVLSAGYVGNKGTHLPWYGRDPNATPVGPGDRQLRRPYPQYGDFWYVDSIGTSNYHALQTRWQRRFTAGFLLRANYTWSKAIVLGEDSLFGAGSGNAGAQDQNCLKCERSPALYDVAHRVALSYVWMTPSGGLRGVSRTILGGWELSGSTIFQSGAPYTIIAPLALPNGDASVRPLLVGDWHVPDKTWERQFNTAAFATPPDFKLGNLGQRTHRMGGLNQWDLGVMKNFSLTETHRIQFRSEFFNAFNHPTFNIPDRSVGSPRFGLVSSSLQRARNIQFGLKYLF
jgi:hypothetical protein